ncbi:MAG: beta-lactamase regulator AmpE [Litorilituus sp.]|jgi:AmpE protein|nr:beta-lactamase regulator AmpE [Litorilituus sp.]
MSLISLLIALGAEKSLSSSLWSFDNYYRQYVNFFSMNNFLSRLKDSPQGYTLFLLLPVMVVYGVLALVDDGLLHLIISTLILIITLGCETVRDSYKQFLQAAFRGEKTTSELCHQQLLQDKNLPTIGFGQALIWLNYRYYIAIMLFFVVFGAPGAIFYRLLTTAIEQQHNEKLDTEEASEKHENIDQRETITTDTEQDNVPNITAGCKNYQHVLFYLDWFPVRITSFGYMFIGHFSKALPVWLESLFDFTKPSHKVLIDVAQKSEDITIDNDDSTAEPCLLVSLAKRNVLLILAVIAAMTLLGVLS